MEDKETERDRIKRKQKLCSGWRAIKGGGDCSSRDNFTLHYNVNYGLPGPYRVEITDSPTVLEVDLDFCFIALENTHKFQRVVFRSASIGFEIMGGNEKEFQPKKLQESHFNVMGLCCSSEVSLIEKLLKSLEGVQEVSIIVPTKTVIVVHDSSHISQLQILKVLNQARMEANVRVKGEPITYGEKWPSPHVIVCGLLLMLSFLKYVYHPFQWLSLAAVAVGAWPILIKAVSAIRNFTVDVSLLISITVVGTIALKDYLEAGSIVFLFTIAEWLQSRANHKATVAMSLLMSLAPEKAVIAETGESVNVENVRLNTILAVKAGDIIPIDGVVVDGNCEVDEKTLTGESFPVAKSKDSVVWAGTINLNGYISVKTTALSEDCVVAKMAKLVEEAQNRKTKTQRFIDTFAKYYTPTVVILAAALAAVPAALRVDNVKHWLHLSLVVLVTGCPCGLILSTPVAAFCALSKAATSGLLIKGGDYLELLAKIKVVAFDKTGTITSGDFTLTDFQSFSHDISISTLLYWVSSIESKSSHPIGSALVDYGRSLSIEPKPEEVEEFENFPGEGICGKIDRRHIYIGNPKIGQRSGCVVDQNVEGNTEWEGKTLGYIYDGAGLIGVFRLSDSCRSGAKEAIRELKSMGIRTAMLTGDSHAAAVHAQEQLGGSMDEIHAELLPEEKARMIQDYKNIIGPTAMIGDGVNDAPALATADVGISMGISGSSLAKETGHVVLMSTDISKIPRAIQLAKRSFQKVVENVIISIAIKAGVVALAIAGHPLIWLAVLADVATCLLVIFNSMLLLGIREHGHRRLPSSALGHAHDKRACCSATSHCSEAPKQCCSKKIDTAPNSFHIPSSVSWHTHDKRTCCTATSHWSESPKQCCSKKTVTEADSVHSHLEHVDSGTCTMDAPKQCCSKKTVTEPDSVHIHSEHVGSSACTMEAPKQCCSKKTVTEPDSVHSHLKHVGSSTFRTGASKQCCSKKTDSVHNHLEQVGSSTCRSEPCPKNNHHHDQECDGEGHSKDKVINHRKEETSVRAAGCGHVQQDQKVHDCSPVDRSAIHVCNDITAVSTACSYHAGATSMAWSEVGCCTSYRKECCRHRHSAAGFGGGLIEIVTE
ncbi:hypothetical protein Nepgr_015454 [Nepenthes gracilis]|uniref:HMA domain-containing protein n=1 Tax=Nepenthes gracilis TaxID=150966 RepID=A0AAD3SLP0_NEPGR|nr:hypothetical protein Nepgr_015454 [Nepenthes gracilis]